MPSNNRGSWGSIAAYFYTLQLDPLSLAWEYLRRNSDYQRDFSKTALKAGGADPQCWGLKAWADPKQDARELEPSWLLCNSPLRVGRIAPRASLPTLDVWRMPGEKTLWHDGEHLHFKVKVAGQLCRVRLSKDVGQDDCFGVSILAGPGFGARARAAQKLRALLDPVARQAVADKPHRPSPRAIMHMLILQALDGEAVGASRRDIARAVFGAFTNREWGADSVWRLRVRYLIQRGRALSAHGYRRMIAAAHGAPLSHSPMP